MSHATHTLDDAQKIYGELLHASLMATAGHTYLTNLKAMLETFNTSPLASHHSPRDTKNDLQWWLYFLSAEKLSRRIHAMWFEDYGAFADASSGFGIAIVIEDHWRA